MRPFRERLTQRRGPARSREFLRVQGNEEAAARSLAKPSCRWLAEDLVSELPEVKARLSDPGPDARLGGIEDANQPGLVEFRMGVHHDDHFEAVIFVSITKGHIEVAGPLGPLQLPPSLEAEVLGACR